MNLLIEMELQFLKCVLLCVGERGGCGRGSRGQAGSLLSRPTIADQTPTATTRQEADAPWRDHPLMIEPPRGPSIN